VDLGDDDEVPIDELIINSSLALLVPEDGPKPPAFRDVVSFIEGDASKPTQCIINAYII
jgi:hypothetical protein